MEVNDNDENKNNTNKCYELHDLKVLAHTASHAYTKLSFASSTKLNERSLHIYSTIFPHIENIDVSHNILQTLYNMSNFKHLKRLNASHNKLTEFDVDVEWDIHKNTGNKSLLQLNVSHNHIMKLDCLSQHIHIEILDLSYNKLQYIDELSCLHLLKNLNISHNNITDLSALYKLPIVELNAAHNNINNMDSISAQYIKICNMNDNKLSNLDCTKEFHQLTELYIAKNNIFDFNALNNLTKLPLLRNLDISQNPVKCDQALQYEILWILPDLQVLNGKNVEAKSKIESKFKHNVFDDKLNLIKQHYTSDDHKFDDNENKIPHENENEFWYRIVEEGFALYWERFITKFPHLSATTIDLSDIKIGNAGLHAVCDSIEECQHLTHLILRNSLSSDRWSDTEYKWPLKYLCDTLLINNTLVYLDLSNCCIDAIKFEPIGYLIENCAGLNTLNLNGNTIGQHIYNESCPAIKVLTDCILKSHSLIKLYINHNEIDGLGAYLIGKCLQNTQCILQDVDISNNPLGINGNGFAQIAKAIRINECLKTLNISYCIENYDCSECMEPILHSLKENKYLTNLNISGNMFSEPAMKYLSLAIQINSNIQCLKMKDIVIDNEAFNLVLTAISNKADSFIELSIDIQSANNMEIVINSLSNHSNLKYLCLSNIQQNKSDTSELDIKQTFCRLVVFDLSKLCLSSKCIHSILNLDLECLTNLNLESSTLDEKCWNSLTKLCNKLALKQLNISKCAINNNCDILKEFFQSKAVRESLIDLNMGNMVWDNNEPLIMFEKLFYELQSVENDRDFCLNLTGISLHEHNIMNNKDCINHLFNVLSNIGVQTLVLDNFIIVHNKTDTMPTTSLKLINEILYCFAQNSYKISSLSIKHNDINIHSQDDALFSEIINSVKLRHISLPKINNKDILTKVLCNLRNCKLKTVEFENEIDEDDMNVILSTDQINAPQIVTNKFINVASKSMDRKLSQYMSYLAYIKCCRV